MADYISNAVQTVEPGGFAVFTNTLVPCTSGFVQHLDGTPNFKLSGWVPQNYNCCCRRNMAEYEIHVGGNLSVPTGGTAGQIAIAITVDGAPVPYSEMDVTPAAVEEYWHVGNEITVPILNGCCQTVAVQIISDQAIQIKNLVLDIKRTYLN